jgi:selenium metabolism protein YedF
MIRAMSTMYVMTAETLGRGDEGLGRRLMVKFVQQLAALSPRPAVVGFYNGGVNLLVPSSPVLEAFKTMEHDGVELIACGTCLDHYQIRDAIAAGRVSDMREILGAMAAAEKTIVV